MSASKLYPKTYKGNEDSGGYIVKNEPRKSANSPHFRGRVYVAGIGWYWVSGWLRENNKGEMISVSLKEISDKEAEQYCAPRQSAKGVNNNEQHNPKDNAVAYEEQVDDSDIPF